MEHRVDSGGKRINGRQTYKLTEVHELLWSGGKFKIAESHPRYNVTEGAYEGFFGEPISAWILEDGIIAIDSDANNVFEKKKDQTGGFDIEKLALANRGKGFLGHKDNFKNPIYEREGKLYLEFANLDETDNGQIIDFVNEHGLLGLYLYDSSTLIDTSLLYRGTFGVHDFDASGKDVPPDWLFSRFDYGEPLLAFKIEIEKMRSIVQAVTTTGDSIDEFFANQSQDLGWGKEAFLHGQAAGIEAVINPRLRQVESCIRATANPDAADGEGFIKVEQRWTCPTLYIALYFQLFQDVMKGENLAECENCGNFFVKTRSDQRLCTTSCRNVLYVQRSQAKRKLKENENAYRNNKISSEEYLNYKSKLEAKLSGDLGLND